MDTAKGYITIERYVKGLSMWEMESILGFRPGRLTEAGCAVFVLLREPRVGEFIYGGSTLFPEKRGLVAQAQRENFPIPGEWLGERLVKVKPYSRTVLPEEAEYPRAMIARASQWKLVVEIPAKEVCRLYRYDDRYWPDAWRVRRASGRPQGAF
jgi:hypothetical protein